MFKIALVLAVIAGGWIYALKAQGKITSVSAYLRRIFLDPKEGLVLTRWLAPLFPPKP